MVQKPLLLFIFVSIATSIVVILCLTRIHNLIRPENDCERLNVITTRHARHLDARFEKAQVKHSKGHHYHRREVIKGTRTDSIADYPYTVSLLNINTRKQEWHVCGGTLIAANIGLSSSFVDNLLIS